MRRILANPTFRALFVAQITALLGTGLATVALTLLAYELVGADAGAVLGTVFTLKMIAYVGIAPLAAAVAERLPRRPMLVALDAVRAITALLLLFVSEVWHMYVLIFVLQAASAAFTPAFQATIPDVLPDEKDYTQALSLSRIAYDLESLLSPLVAAAVLVIVSFDGLFIGTAIGFVASAALVASAAVPRAGAAPTRRLHDAALRGTRLYLATPRLRGLLTINLAVAAGGAMVLVNTVVIVQGTFGLSQMHTALALAAFGGGSMLAALALPRLLDRLPDRTVMLAGAAVMAVGLLIGAVLANYPMLLLLWTVIGAGYGAAQTPTGRLLRRSAAPEGRPALFAAQFALSHACWLITYPLAGWLGASLDLQAAFLVLAGVAAGALGAGLITWPRGARGDEGCDERKRPRRQPSE